MAWEKILSEQAVTSGSVTLSDMSKLGKYAFKETEEPLPTAGPLCFTANEDSSTIAMSMGQVTFTPDLSYSTDGTNWDTFTVGTTTITLANTGDKVYFKGNNPQGLSRGTGTQLKFVLTGSIAASGNIMSLLDDGACTTLELPYTYAGCFAYLFAGCTSLTTAPTLPATKLSWYCYFHMFDGCTSLIAAPALPATDLGDYSSKSGYQYAYMFNGCTALTTSPALPATTLTAYCYAYMFYGCTALTAVSNLSAMTLAKNCCIYMFNGCTALTAVQILPATTLAEKCYDHMFNGCTALITAPVLPATTLATSCYSSMFYGCTALTTSPALPATTLAANCYQYMFAQCTALTTGPALPATTLFSGCYYGMFQYCRSLYASTTVRAGKAEQAWTIPASGTFTAASTQNYMFLSCLATSNNGTLTATAGGTVTFYTQNAQVA